MNAIQLNTDYDRLKTASVVVSPNQISSDIEGESVILNLKSGTYFGLNEVGSRVWQLIQSQRHFRDISATLCHEYVVDAEVCDRDLLALLVELSTAGLILVNP